jgi:hypothetical protein
MVHSETRAAGAKREGVYYARTDDGVELPIIDVTHPAFAVELDAAAQARFVEQFLSERQPLDGAPVWLRRALFLVFLRNSALGRGLLAAEGTFLSGMNTYLCKLGPDNLGPGYASELDKKIAASAPAFGMRLRLRDVAELLAECTFEALSRTDATRPLVFASIAGGPAVDVLNALMLVRRRAPDLLARRRTEIVDLDLQAAGPSFGARALAELKSAGAPLAGLDVELRHGTYDWRDSSLLYRALAPARERGAVVLASSEGGLFDYGSDAEIVENLRALAESSGPELTVTGSSTRDDAPMQKVRRTSRVKTVPRSLAALRSLVARAGFAVATVRERPFSDHFVLERLNARRAAS